MEVHEPIYRKTHTQATPEASEVQTGSSGLHKSRRALNRFRFEIRLLQRSGREASTQRATPQSVIQPVTQ